MTTQFAEAFGFERRDVTLANWRTAPFSPFSFGHAEEIVPSASIAAMAEVSEGAPLRSPLLTQHLPEGLAGQPDVGAYLDYAHTDAFVLMKAGRIVAEHYAPHAGVNQRHIIFSISKSLTALVIATLEADGLIDPDA
ncbi:MAG: 6-aminohexanoate hydrolase, partial [Rhizobium rosettiformans]